MKLFNRQGQPVDVPDADVPAALSSGQYGAPNGTQVPVRYGSQIGSVPIEKLTEHLANGAEVITPSEYERADLQARYGDVGHAALVAGTEALDTATLGLSNAAIGGLGGKGVRETLRKSVEANPTAAGAGTVAGIVVPVVADIATGGAATPALAGAVERAGEKALVGAGERALARGAESAFVRGGEEAATAGLARTAPVAEGVLESAPRALPGVAPEMTGEALGAEARALPSSALSPTGIAQEIEGELVREGAGRAPRALPEHVADAEFEAVGANAARNTGIVSSELGLSPEVVSSAKPAATAAEHAEQVAEAARVVERAEQAGGATEEAAAQAAGEGLIRQVVETSLLGPQRLVTGGGQAVEDYVRGIIGKEAETALGRIAQKAVVGAARGTFEGGIYGVGNELGHQFLQEDPELSGERLASAWFHGALLGGAFGGGLGAVGQGAKEALAKAVGREGISEALSRKSGEFLWHAAGPTQKMTAEANKYAGGAWKVGNLIRDDALEILGRAPASREELLELAPEIQKKHAAILESVLDRLDKAEGAERIKVREIYDRLEAIKQDLVKRAAPTGQIENFQQRILDATGAYKKVRVLDELGPAGTKRTEVLVDPNATVSFTQLRNFRTTVDDMLKFGANGGLEKAPDAAMHEARTWLENRVMGAADKVANDAGGTLLKDYKAAKEGYQAGKLLEEAAARGKAAQGTNHHFSLTDKLIGIAEASGHGIGHAVAGPLGGLATGLASAQASKYVRHKLDFVVSDVLARLANVPKGEHVLNAAQKSAERVEKRFEQGMGSIRKGLAGKDIGERPPIGGPKTFEERRETLLNVAAQHQAVVDHLDSVTSPLDKAAPNVASSLKSASLKALTYLMDALPKPPPPRADSLTPQLDAQRWEPSDQAKNRFNRTYDIVAHPELLPHLVAAGQVTSEHVSALQATSPKSLAAAQKKLQAEIDKQTKPPPAHMRSSIRLVLGRPLVDPSIGQMYQSNFKPAQPRPAPRRPLKLADNTSLNASIKE